MHKSVDSIENVNQYTRGEMRFQIAGEPTVTLVLDWNESRAKPRALTARLLDLSPHGARLALSVPLPTHKASLLTVSLRERAVHFHAEAHACWSEQYAAGEYIVGCRLLPGITEDVFRRLVTDEPIDRRELPDQQSRSRFQFVHRLDDTVAPIWGILLNYSRGGFCFSTAAAQSISLGDRIQVLLRAEESLMLVAVVRWKLEQGGDCLLGCRFLGRRAAERLRQAIDLAALEKTAMRPAGGASP